MPEICGQTITIFDSVEIAKVVYRLPSKLDIGKLTSYMLDEKNIQMQDILYWTN
jgi:hypothetical protein